MFHWFFLVDLSQKIFFYIQAIVDIITADYNVYIVGADIPLAMANALGIPIPSGDDDPDKKDKTGFTCSLNDMEKIKANLASVKPSETYG